MFLRWQVTLNSVFPDTDVSHNRCTEAHPGSVTNECQQANQMGRWINHTVSHLYTGAEPTGVYICITPRDGLRDLHARSGCEQHIERFGAWW